MLYYYTISNVSKQGRCELHMTDTIAGNQDAWPKGEDTPHTNTLSDEFLSKLVTELDNENVTAIVLHGSYVRSDATYYSDVCLVRLVRETQEPTQSKQYTYRDSLLVSISTRTIAQYRKRFTRPEEAIFAVPGIREARILLDKEGAFQTFQQEARAFRWEPLQTAANDYASHRLMTHTEYVFKILRALYLKDTIALLEMILDLLYAVTDIIAVQRGILITSGNTYLRQILESVGRGSPWTQYSLLAAGVDSNDTSGISLEQRGMAALRLYRETVHILQPSLNAAHRDVIEQSIAVMESALPGI